MPVFLAFLYNVELDKLCPELLPLPALLWLSKPRFGPLFCLKNASFRFPFISKLVENLASLQLFLPSSPYTRYNGA
jgi:hypothetical protein